MSTHNWEHIRAWLRWKFEGKVRKDGTTPMVGHSIQVGNTLKDRNYDAITVVGGYLHDVYEDVDITIGDVYHLCEGFFADKSMATVTTELVMDVSYREYEYAGDRDYRKQSANRRWLTTEDIRTVRVKIADVESNMQGNGPGVDPAFIERYMLGAVPLLKGLRAREAELNQWGQVAGRG